MKLQTVHLRINDAATMKPTPAMLRITDAAGQEYAPFGRHLDFGVGVGEDVGGSLFVNREKWFAIDGAAEIALPPGELRVQIRKGHCFSPIDQIVNQPAGKMAMRFVLERAWDPRAEGWFQVDTRCHWMSPHEAALDGAVEDIDVVNLLAKPFRYLGRTGKTHLATPGIEAFSGQTAALEKHGTQVVVNTFNEHPVLGKLALLHCHRVVYPLTFGPEEDAEHWSLSDWCSQCHRKHGLVVWSGAYRPNAAHSGEALAAAILGEVDALEVSPEYPLETVKTWYRLLNAGVVLPLVGGSGKCSNSRAIGAMRTYVRTGTDHWSVAVKASDTVVSSGPFVELHHQSGSLTTFASGRGMGAQDRLEIVADGKVIATGEPGVLSLDAALGNAGWIAARIVSQGSLAHTSARVLQHRRADTEWLRDDLARGREWVESSITEAKFREQLIHMLDAATTKLC